MFCFRKNIVLLILFLILGSLVFGQDEDPLKEDIQFRFKVSDFFSSENIAGANVVITLNNETIANLTVDKNGDFEFTLDFDQEYELAVSKKGFVSKKVLINTFNVPEKRRRKMYIITAELTLFKPMKCMDITPFKNPVGKARYYESEREITWDFDYGDGLAEKLSKLLLDCKEQLEKEEAEKERNEQKYEQLVKSGDKASKNQDWEKAKKDFKEAIALLPEKPEAKEKLKAVEEQIKKIEDEEKAKVQAAKEEEEKKQQEEAQAAKEEEEKKQQEEAQAAKEEEEEKKRQEEAQAAKEEEEKKQQEAAQAAKEEEEKKQQEEAQVAKEEEEKKEEEKKKTVRHSTPPTRKRNVSDETRSNRDHHKILDLPWIKENTPTRRVSPYTHVREADVMWSRRIWREIDLREKINHPLYYPTSRIRDRKSLFDVIKDAVKSGELSAYDPMDDEFKVKLTLRQAEERTGDSVTIMLEDEYGDLTVPSTTYSPLESQDVIKYWLKEEWFFDNERSIMDVRILGICPLSAVLDENGEYKGLKQVYWIYFPEARYIFANYDAFNRQNDAERRTFEDIFKKRFFGSYIIKKSNVYNDRSIIDYKSNIDALLEAERIKQEIFIQEHDVWSF